MNAEQAPVSMGAIVHIPLFISTLWTQYGPIWASHIKMVQKERDRPLVVLCLYVLQLLRCLLITVCNIVLLFSQFWISHVCIILSGLKVVKDLEALQAVIHNISPLLYALICYMCVFSGADPCAGVPPHSQPGPSGDPTDRRGAGPDRSKDWPHPASSQRCL